MLINFYTYIGVLFLCLAVSLFNTKARQRFLWLYFLIILVFELGLFSKIISYKIYQFSFFIYLPLYVYIYLNEYRNKFFLVIPSIICFSLGMIYFFYEDNSQIQLGVLMSLIIIYMSLLWFYNQIKNIDNIAITKKQLFWVSVALLFMGVVFIFRIVPMYYFDKADKAFFKIIDNGYQYCVIISYIIFLKSLFHKQ